MWITPRDRQGFENQFTNILQNEDCADVNINSLNCTITKVTKASQQAFHSKNERAKSNNAELRAKSEEVSKAIRIYHSEKIQETIEQNRSLKVLKKKIFRRQNRHNQIREQTWQYHFESRPNAAGLQRNSIKNFIKVASKHIQIQPQKYGVLNQVSEELPDITPKKSEKHVRKR